MGLSSGGTDLGNGVMGGGGGGGGGVKENWIRAREGEDGTWL